MVCFGRSSNYVCDPPRIIKGRVVPSTFTRPLFEFDFREFHTQNKLRMYAVLNGHSQTLFNVYFIKNRHWNRDLYFEFFHCILDCRRR